MKKTFILAIVAASALAITGCDNTGGMGGSESSDMNTTGSGSSTTTEPATNTYRPEGVAPGTVDTNSGAATSPGGTATGARAGAPMVDTNDSAGSQQQ